MRARRAEYELPCTSCHVNTREDLLTDASERAPFLGLVCPGCDDTLTYEEHGESGESCDCDACERASHALERERTARFAEAVGGLHAAVVEFELFNLTELLGKDSK